MEYLKLTVLRVLFSFLYHLWVKGHDRVMFFKKTILYGV